LKICHNPLSPLGTFARYVTHLRGTFARYVTHLRGTFARYVTHLRGTFVEIVKSKKKINPPSNIVQTLS
jgi:hypothetical protein